MKKNIITDVKGYEVLDSRGNPTVLVEVYVDYTKCGWAMVPSGASTGDYEAYELRDGDNRYNGKGVLQACENVNTSLKKAVDGMSIFNQREIDKRLIEADGTENKKKLGANAILGVSLACARAGAKVLGVSLFRYIGGANAHKLPVPMMNVINGGKHSDNNLSMQEFMIMPVGAPDFKEGLRWCAEVYESLNRILKKEGYSTAVGDEGGFAPNFANEEMAIEYIIKGINGAGYNTKEHFKIALDPATSEMLDKGNYHFWKTGKTLTPAQMIDMWESWVDSYPICSIEDPLAQDDFSNYTALTKRIGNKVQLVGDDLFVTNIKRLKHGIDERACNAILIKPNQIGTLTETMDAIEMAKNSGYKAVISHRSGETEDMFIADLAVGLNCGQIKTGAPARGERTAKYNRLLAIERQLKGE